MTISRTQKPTPTPRGPATALRPRALQAAIAMIVTHVSTAVYAAPQLGSGLISYAQPIILFLGVGAVVVALVGSAFKPELVKSAVWAAVILVIIFFILRNVSALQSAVQAG